MYLCYVDESGDAGQFLGRETDVPAFVVSALIVSQDDLDPLTRGWIELKRRFYPNVHREQYLDSILEEVKGDTLRRNVRRGGRRSRQHAIGFLDGTVRLCERFGVRLLAKALIKADGAENSDAGFYASAMQHVCMHFNHFLGETGTDGFVIADGRRKSQNRGVAHCIFTQMFRHGGSAYPRILEMPTFGHSNNHAMLQVSDIVCSGILFPAVVMAYCGDVEGNVHVDAAYEEIRLRYIDAVRGMQYRYFDARWSGGFFVTDARSSRNSAALFRV